MCEGAVCCAYASYRNAGAARNIAHPSGAENRILKLTGMRGTMTRRDMLLAWSAGAAGIARGGQRRHIRTVAVPGGGIQPQAAVDTNGVLHLVYYSGPP